jgi:hypothetical protein
MYENMMRCWSKYPNCGNYPSNALPTRATAIFFMDLLVNCKLGADGIAGSSLPDRPALNNLRLQYKILCKIPRRV